MLSKTQNARLAGSVVLQAALCLGVLQWSPAWADITIEGTHSPGFSGGVDRQVIYLRDDQMRIDQLMQGDGQSDSVASSFLIRFSGQPQGLLYIDHGSRTVEVLSALSTVGAASSDSDAAVNLVRRDETWEILGQTAHRYDFSFSSHVDPMVLLGEQLAPGMAGMVSIRLNVTGTFWVVPGMDGATELAEFFAALATKKLALKMMGRNSAVTGQQGPIVPPSVERAVTNLMARITREGFPLLTETRSELSVDTEGYVAEMVRALLRGMGMDAPQSTESIVTRVNTSTVAPELFYGGALPTGYTLTKP